MIFAIAIFGLSKPSFAQGLEGIAVEKYYISNANDASVNGAGGVLPVGSVTYRIFADLAPGYQFQAVYGDANHELRLETTTLFFNNEDRGAPFPTFSKNFCDDNTVMLDSWISVGAACASNFGVLKVNDDGVATVVNNDGVLLNNDPLMGIPLTQQDGFIAGTPQAVTAVNVTALETMLDAQKVITNLHRDFSRLPVPCYPCAHCTLSSSNRRYNCRSSARKDFSYFTGCNTISPIINTKHDLFCFVSKISSNRENRIPSNTWKQCAS